jgi:murein L,D-transpeptidase YafK
MIMREGGNPWKNTVLAALAVGLTIRFLAPVPPAEAASLEQRLRLQNMRAGAPVFIRIFKRESLLELWLKTGGAFRLFHSYPICNWSGKLGPKLKTGDHQSPEGFYTVGRRQLNPGSRYHLALNLGYPNAYDRAHGRTGKYLMVHGDCVSWGCYAMTNPAIDDIYALVKAALRHGQQVVNVHIFPFRMTAANMAKQRKNRWYGFWKNLKQGYDRFERTRVPPVIRVRNKAYVVGGPALP